MSRHRRRRMASLVISFATTVVRNHRCGRQISWFSNAISARAPEWRELRRGWHGIRADIGRHGWTRLWCARFPGVSRPGRQYWHIDDEEEYQMGPGGIRRSCGRDRSRPWPVRSEQDARSSQYTCRDFESDQIDAAVLSARRLGMGQPVGRACIGAGFPRRARHGRQDCGRRGYLDADLLSLCRQVGLLAEPSDVVERGLPSLVVEAADTVQGVNDFITALSTRNSVRSKLNLAEIVEKRSRALYAARR